jgi:hypothetical protein
MHWPLHEILLRYYMKVDLLPFSFENVNTVVVVGLNYGFLTTFSIDPS